jgi:hypothetical protein
MIAVLRDPGLIAIKSVPSSVAAVNGPVAIASKSSASLAANGALPACRRRGRSPFARDGASVNR